MRNGRDTAARRPRHGRDGRRAAGRALLLAAAALGLAQCRPAPGLETQPLFGLAPEHAGASSIAPAGAGGVWLGVAGALVELDARGVALRRIDTGAGAPRVVDAAGGLALLRADTTLVLADLAAGAVAARARLATEHDARLVAQVGFVLRTTGDGAVVGLGVDSLLPRWSWPRHGRAATALAISPYGDRAYLALAAGADATAELATIEVQTGRVLARDPIPGTALQVEADRRGTLHLLLDDDGRALVVALRPSGGELQTLWRQRLDGAARAGALRVAGDGARVAVLGAAEEGVAVIDGADGAVAGRIEEGPVDAAFAADGALLLLYRDEVRVLR